MAYKRKRSFKRRSKRSRKGKRSYKKSRYSRSKFSKGGMPPLSKLLRSKQYDSILKESTITASNTATVTYAQQFSSIALTALAGARDDQLRTSSKIYMDRVKFKLLLQNNASQEVYVRLAIVRAKAGIASSVFTGNNPSVLGVREPTATEYMEDNALSAQNAQNAHSMLLDFDKESIGKVYYSKIFKLGPTGGAGSISSSRICRWTSKVKRVLKYESADADSCSNGKIWFLASVYDPSNDTAAAQSVELTAKFSARWYDSIN